MADLVGLLCVFGLFAVLGGCVAIMLYGVRGTAAMLRGWLGGK